MNHRGIARLGIICGLSLGLSACALFPHGRPWLAFLPHPRPAVKVQAIPAVPPGPVYRPDEGLYRDAASAIAQRDYGLALDLLQAARDRDPNDPRVFNAFGVVYDKLGRFDLSEEFYNQAETLDPGSPVVAANRAYSRVLQGRAAAPGGLFASNEPAQPTEPGAIRSCADAKGQAVCIATGGTSW